MILPKVEVKKILYATDLSKNARHAFAYAVSLANAYNASITIIHVLFDSPTIDSVIAPYMAPEQWAQIKQRHLQDAREALVGKKRENVALREVLTQFFETARREEENKELIMDEILIKKGNPAENIVAQAKESNCDLIVMGSHGHGALASAMMGSTTQQVLRWTHKPVLVVRYPKGEE